MYLITRISLRFSIACPERPLSAKSFTPPSGDATAEYQRHLGTTQRLRGIGGLPVTRPRTFYRGIGTFFIKSVQQQSHITRLPVKLRLHTYVDLSSRASSPDIILRRHILDLQGSLSQIPGLEILSLVPWQDLCLVRPKQLSQRTGSFCGSLPRHNRGNTSD